LTIFIKQPTQSCSDFAQKSLSEQYWKLANFGEHGKSKMLYARDKEL
jgi:hypothetical protein